MLFKLYDLRKFDWYTIDLVNMIKDWLIEHDYSNSMMHRKILYDCEKSCTRMIPSLEKNNFRSNIYRKKKKKNKKKNLNWFFSIKTIDFYFNGEFLFDSELYLNLKSNSKKEQDQTESNSFF